MSQIDTKRPFTDAAKESYLNLLAKWGNPRRCAKKANISYSSVLTAKKNDPEFLAAFEDALEEFAESLEEVAVERAVDGWEQPIYQNGIEVGTIRKFDNRLLETLLKANKPQKYSEKAQVDVKMTGGVLLVPAPQQSEERWFDTYKDAETLAEKEDETKALPEPAKEPADAK